MISKIQSHVKLCFSDIPNLVSSTFSIFPRLVYIFLNWEYTRNTCITIKDFKLTILVLKAGHPGVLIVLFFVRLLCGVLLLGFLPFSFPLAM